MSYRRNVRPAHRPGILLAAALLAFTPVAAAGQDAAGRNRQEPARIAPTKRASVAKVDAARLARIPARMREFIDEGQIAGAVTLVAQGGRVVHFEAVGQADIEKDRPMRKDTIFGIASMTKPITATAVLILQDEGRLTVEDPVSRYIPSFRNVTVDGKAPAREITIRDLMTHTSGVNRPPRRQGESSGSLKAIAGGMARQPLQFEPGSRWKYGSGLTVCGRIIEVVSGKPYEVFLRERIFDPLKMADTTFHPDAARWDRVATLYRPGEEKGTLAPVKERPFSDDPSARRVPNPSGGLFSTADDMRRFYQMILNGGEFEGRRIVSRAAVVQMTRLHTGDLTTGFTPGNGWGLGWCVVREPQGVTEMLSPGTHGHGGAFGTQGWIDPRRGMIYVLMIQRTAFGNSDGSEIRRVFQEMASRAVEDRDG